MKVHIVVAELPETDHVLSRLAGYLAERTGFTIGTTPRSDVDLVYFFPYLILAQHYPDWHDTPIACYFSHYDANTDKAVFWDKAAEKTDYALVTAPQYAARLKRHNLNAVFVHAPVDPQFQPSPSPRPVRLKPMIGVSGMVYGDGRKGEDLVRQLAQDLPQYIWRATGRGWNIPTTFYPFKQLPSFYQDLDVFVCTSRVEGVPMPPLEALASGVPIVIPRGVGMLDELPDTPGITRYPAGDYDALKQAVLQAVSGYAVHRGWFEWGIQDYTPRRWVSDHLQAFENWLNPLPKIETLPQWDASNAGVVYVAYGKPARECVQDAIASWRQHMVLPVALVSDAPLGVEDVFCPYPDSDIGARSAKLKIDSLLPAHWKYILYLDADTELVAPVPFLFDALVDGWEFVICKNPGKYADLRQAKRPDNHEELDYTFEVLNNPEVLQLNGGVFAYRRNPRTARFFGLWFHEWFDRWGLRDQTPLLRALHYQPLRVYTLYNQWNTVVAYDDPSTSAGILHYPQTARRWSGLVGGRLDSKSAWEKVNK